LADYRPTHELEQWLVQQTFLTLKQRLKSLSIHGF